MSLAPQHQVGREVGDSKLSEAALDGVGVRAELAEERLLMRGKLLEGAYIAVRVERVRRLPSSEATDGRLAGVSFLCSLYGGCGRCVALVLDLSSYTTRWNGMDCRSGPGKRSQCCVAFSPSIYMR